MWLQTYFVLDCAFIITFCYVLAPIAIIVLDIILPLNETRPKTLVYPAEYLVNPEKYYYILLLSEYIGFVICVLIGIITDTTYYLLLAHICGMYAILW